MHSPPSGGARALAAIWCTIMVVVAHVARPTAAQGVHPSTLAATAASRPSSSSLMSALGWDRNTAPVPTPSPAPAHAAAAADAHHADAREFCTLADEARVTLFHKRQHPLSCRTQKYLILEWPKMGFGASLTSGVAALSLAVRDHRILIIHSEWDTGFFSGLKDATNCPNANAQNPWECYFEPASNCTLADALAEAGVHSLEELKKTPKRFAQWTYGNKITKLAKPMLEHVLYADVYVPWLSEELKKIRGLSSVWNNLIPRDHDDLFLALGMQYLIRLNPAFKAQLRPLLEKVVPERVERRAARTVALPIRGSDKCGKPVTGDKGERGSSRFEATCLPFKTYMNAVEHVKTYDSGIKTVIVTSEDPTYIESAQAFAQSEEGSGYDMVFNTVDEHQGDSRMEVMAKSGHFDHKSIMVSMWTTLELQMNAKYYIVNCNSHWHIWMFAMRKGLCGHTAPVIVCLDEQHARSPFFMCTQDNQIGKANLKRCQAHMGNAFSFGH